jgi:hypothetical protein
MGTKLAHTCRTYNLTVNHRCRILSTTTGHPARWNDKTFMLFDDFVRGMLGGKYLSDVEFSLLERDSEGIVSSIKYKGGWLLVDNGRLSWSTTMHPMKI